ncbi:Outer membrane protein W [Tenacibaculum sp. MAR_2009_124]|uniref:OmpW/AlkL family protein n=1 Tax=Tenacibaculum sp. MAR_2009_124 TaxID=1250059 RepID=UPI00089A6FE6|nr:OmpW family outer membrane protein [Tenacibaculum sp. MAR_2009_124]SEB45352.1 Outer membrane protein W [Tenacibaculum sp. MAR_2009_124]
MNNLKQSLITFLLFLSTIGVSNAQKGFYAQAGFLQISFQESSSVSIAGNTIDGATLKLSDPSTGAIQIGYFLNDNISLSTVLTIPPKTSIQGEGPLSTLTIGEATITPLFLLGNYHFDIDKFKPFLGAGIVYAIIDTEDNALTNLEADNAFGISVRGGIDYFFNDKIGINASATYSFLKTDAIGSVASAIPVLGGAPATATLTLNPIAIQFGMVYNF